MAKALTTGKLSASKLAELLSRHVHISDPDVIIGPTVGVDAAAVQIHSGTWVLASDPVTYATDQIGWYAVHVNANDVFVSGAQPRWFLANILLPAGKETLAEEVFAQISQACGELGVVLVGGHTELTPDLPRPMVAGFMVGSVTMSKPISAGGVRAGDRIVLTKGVAIEGTAILATEHERELRCSLPDELLARAKQYLRYPGISVGAEATLAARQHVHAMHDPTEGGLLNGLWEMAQASDVALEINVDAVPILPETMQICKNYGLDPLRLLASGALLIACSSTNVNALLATLAKEDIEASQIGQAHKGPGHVLLSSGPKIEQSVSDEILKVMAAT